MPTYYKREIADLNGTGEKQYRYELRSEGAVGTEYIAQRLHSTYRALGKPELVGIIGDVVSAIAETLAEGRTVTIDNMGSFSLSLGLEDYSKDTVKTQRTGEPNARRICVTNVRFKAQRQFIGEVNNLCRGRLHRDASGPVTLRRPQSTLEERIQLALQHIRQHGFMRLIDYVQLTGLSRTTASKELRTLVRDSSVPITSEGLRTHKVYVEMKGAEG